MNFVKWNEFKLGDIFVANYGKSLPKKNRIEGKYNVYGSGGITGTHENALVKGPGIIIGRKGTVGSLYYEKNDFYPIDTVYYIAESNKFDLKFLFYKLRTLGLNQMNTHSAVPGLNREHMYSQTTSIPSLNEQKAIAKILSDLDEKIETNNQINKKLEEMAQAIFKQWFVDFEFSNEDGKPYKSSGGEMIESELGMIPKGWSVSELGEIIELFDSKRIPLSKNEREKRQKIYPYYGAASLVDYVDDYIFDGIYILMGEDGTVVTNEGYPILQYVWGKFWVNNHAHVIKARCEIADEFIYILLKNINVNSIVTGAVQPKINQQNLKALKTVIPKNKRILMQYGRVVKGLFEQLRILSDENRILIRLRDTLLPKLMSGEIRVPLDIKQS